MDKKKTKIYFDLAEHNEPVITFDVLKQSDDVRDKVARSFFERLGDGQDLKIIFTENDELIEGMIIPIPA